MPGVAHKPGERFKVFDIQAEHGIGTALIPQYPGKRAVLA
jgi:hypothetical protein